MDFNKIKEMGLEYAEKGKNAALDLAEKGRTQAKIVNAQSKLYKAQRQLGALVYSLAKGNEENQPLVDKYIEMIANIEQELSDLKASLEPDTVIETTFEDTEEAAADVRRYLECDLLIVDDLGTELVTPFVQDALYQLINGRIVAEKRTIINSNLDEKGIRQRYSPQIASRLGGEYYTLVFVGDDIRKIRQRRM